MKKRLLLLITFLLFIANPIMAEEKPDINEEIIYDILVDRFSIGNQALNEHVRPDDPLAYHGGDIVGITKKLDHIEELGFTTIMLSPIMENVENGYHGYWVEDFYAVEEQLGTMEDMKKLVEEAHGRGIKIILEFAPNYVSIDHPFVNEADKAAWFKENKRKASPATEWLDEVAVFDTENDEVIDYLIDVGEYWLKETGVDGFKLHDADVSSELFLNRFAEDIKGKYPDVYLLAGISEENKHNEAILNEAYFDGKDNQAMLEKMNDVFTEPDKPVSVLYDELVEHSEQRNLLTVDNKNTARFSNNFADKGRNALTTWKLAMTYMYTTPGVPVIYQGSEVPMYGPGFPENQSLVEFTSIDQDLEEFYEQISSLRKEFPVLVHGDIELIDSSGAMSLFKRTFEGESIYVAINNDEETQTITLEDEDVESGQQLMGVLGDNLIRENSQGEFRVSVPRETAEVFIVEEDVGFNWWLIGFIVGVFVLFVFFINFASRNTKKEAN
ncbi:MAG TPA: alpha-amylase family glycosyl hydrolase [Virgibacillus sp.]|nr:alpha-amylase family glycosyl hydrolase [Virgibacillus sp.]